MEVFGLILKKNDSLEKCFIILMINIIISFLSYLSISTLGAVWRFVYSITNSWSVKASLLQIV